VLTPAPDGPRVLRRPTVPPQTGIPRVGLLGEWAFGIEYCGAEGAAEATLARLSAGTETISVYREANAFEHLSYWIGGQPWEHFEPGMDSTRRAASVLGLRRTPPRRPARSREILAVMRAVEDHTRAHLTEETSDGPCRPWTCPGSSRAFPRPCPHCRGPIPRRQPPAAGRWARAPPPDSACRTRPLPSPVSPSRQRFPEPPAVSARPAIPLPDRTHNRSSHRPDRMRR
jgi:hypothetical protein